MRIVRIKQANPLYLFDDILIGYGRMQWPDGQMYCGGWQQNKRWGRGIQTDADGTVIHCGQWKNNEPVGQLVSEAVDLDDWQIGKGEPQSQSSDEASYERDVVTEDGSDVVPSSNDCRNVVRGEGSNLVKIISSARLVV